MLKKLKRKHIISIFTIIVLLTIGRLIWLFLLLPANSYIAENGVLDLRNTTLQNDDMVNLDGDWMYYPEILLNPENPDLSKNSYTYASIPFNEEQLEAHSYGTYRLKVIVDKNYAPDFRYCIRVPAIETASALYVNGNLLEQSGNVGVDKNAHEGKNAPFMIYFTDEEQTLDIILHVSNFDTEQAIRINKHINFGSAEVMTKKVNIIKFSLTTIAIILILHAIYSLLVYTLIFRKKIVLFFVVGFIFPLLDELLTYDRSILDFINISYAGTIRISNVIYLLSVFFYVQFMRILLTKYSQHVIFSWLNRFYYISILLICIIPLAWYDVANIFFFLLYFISFIAIAVLALKEFLDNQRESIFLVITLLSTMSGIIWGLIKASFILDIPFYPFDYLIAILAFTSYWFKRFYENTKTINALVTDLKKEDQEKDAFLTNSAQRLWNPVNKMITIAQFIYDNDQNSLSSQDRKNIKDLIDIGSGIKFTLNDLTDFTRLKHDSLHLQRKKIHVHATLTGVTDMMKFMLDEKLIELSVVPSKIAIYAVADEQRFIQIVFNLLYNAILHTPAGKVEINAHVQDKFVVITIHSHSQLNNETFEQEFQDPYHKGNDFSEEFGLGLMISKQLIELHSGTFNIQTSIENGTIYYFTLPFLEQSIIYDNEIEHYLSDSYLEETNLSTFSRHNTVSELGHFMILAIDYDPLNLKVIRHIFSSEKYELITATSSQQALELVDQFEWDLIIVDAMMPDVSGYGIIQKIRTRFSFVELPIILLTASDHPEDVHSGFAYGANDYVKKPINALELKARSRILIDMKYYFSERLQMETAWLQAQIQPHFLFNTLNTIASLSDIDQDRMIDLMTHFGNYLRASFDSKNLQRVIPIQDELQLVSSYLFIEQERFGDLLHVEWDVDEHISISVPPIAIQTVVENAVRHGVTKKDGGGTIWIRIKDHSNYVEISIVDNGVGMDAQKADEILNGSNQQSKGIGLKNTNERLKRIFSHGLTIQSKPNEGTTVTLKIPKEKN